jgi:hypothetical protein
MLTLSFDQNFLEALQKEEVAGISLEEFMKLKNTEQNQVAVVVFGHHIADVFCCAGGGEQNEPVLQAETVDMARDLVGFLP